LRAVMNKSPGSPRSYWLRSRGNALDELAAGETDCYAVSDNRIRIQRISALGTDVKLLDF